MFLTAGIQTELHIRTSTLGWVACEPQIEEEKMGREVKKRAVVDTLVQSEEPIINDVNSALLVIKTYKRSEISENTKQALLEVLKITFPIAESKNKSFANIYGGTYDSQFNGIKFTLTSDKIPVFNKKGEVKSTKTENLLFTVSCIDKGQTLKYGTVWDKEPFLGISASLRETFTAVEINW